MTLWALAKRLGRPDGCPIIDQTGLSGAYDFRFEWGADAPARQDGDTGVASDPSPWAPLIVALRSNSGFS